MNILRTTGKQAAIGIHNHQQWHCVTVVFGIGIKTWYAIEYKSCKGNQSI